MGKTTKSVEIRENYCSSISCMFGFHDYEWKIDDELKLNKKMNLEYGYILPGTQCSCCYHVYEGPIKNNKKQGK
jgi:hypothetical protein